MFYTYQQNNSGGSFDINPDQGISVFVVVEADHAAEANRRAIGIGLYFDGVYRGIDCECCGNRWYKAWEGTGCDTPSLYSNPIDGAKARFAWARNAPEGFIHYKDGLMKAVWVKDSQYEVTPWPPIPGEIVTDTPELDSVN